MRGTVLRSSLLSRLVSFRAPLAGVLLAACGASEDISAVPSESLGTQQSALCSGLSITALSIDGISSYKGELASAGSWAVSTSSNAARLEYFVDGQLRSSDERTGTSGNWYFSSLGTPCGAHTFVVRAYPMVVDSNGNRTTCWESPTAASQTVIQDCPGGVATGFEHSVAVKKDGSIWTWGSNDYGELGDTTPYGRIRPAQVPGVGNGIAVAAGFDHTVALKLDGTVWTWGRNTYGALGDGTNTNRWAPVRVSELSNVIAISSGSFHTVALKEDGTVWAWGSNTFGQLGDGTTTQRWTPVRVTGLTNVMALSSGYSHVVALKRDGTVWTWGDNRYGQLGDGTLTQRSTPIQVAGLGNVIAVSGGGSHTVALKQDGTVWTWGRNENGELGDGTTINRLTPVQVRSGSGFLGGVAAISGGVFHSMVVKKDGTVWTWGDNNTGQLGYDTSGVNPWPMPTGLGNVTTIAAGHFHSLALAADGTGWAWGGNWDGQLGNGEFADSTTPVQFIW